MKRKVKAGLICMLCFVLLFVSITVSAKEAAQVNGIGTYEYSFNGKHIKGAVVADNKLVKRVLVDDGEKNYTLVYNKSNKKMDVSKEGKYGGIYYTYFNN